MVRSIGFGRKKTEKPSTKREDQNQGLSPRVRKKFFTLIIVLMVMDGVGIALILKSLQDNNINGMIAGAVFSAITTSVFAFAIIRTITGQKRRQKDLGDRHNWALDGKDTT